MFGELLVSAAAIFGGMLFQKQLNVNVHIKNIRMKYSDNSCFYINK